MQHASERHNKTVKSIHSLSFILSIRLLVFSFLLLLISSFIQLGIQYLKELDTIEENLQYIDKSYKEFISRSLYNYDISQLELEMNGMLMIPYISYVEITDLSLDSRNIYKGGDENASRDKVRKTELIYRQGNDAIVIGELLVSASLTEMLANIGRRAALQLAASVIVILALSLFTLLMVRNMITTKLAFMAAYTRRLNVSRLEEPLVLPSGRNGTLDELDYVAGALDDLRRRLKEDIEHRESIEKDLETVNQDLKEMVYIASHDLQVPIVSIESYASELLEEYGEKLDENGLYCIERLKSNAMRMHSLVVSLLDISRLNTREYTHEWIEVCPMIDKIREDLRIMLEKADSSIVCGKLPQIYADRLRMESVFRNLIVNAVKYGSTRVEIGYTPEEGFLVSDNGIGIPESQLERIFKPGERLKEVKTEGVGMGLTFCRKVIEKHDGSIRAFSGGSGSGSTFYIVLPPERIRFDNEEVNND